MGGIICHYLSIYFFISTYFSQPIRISIFILFPLSVYLSLSLSLYIYIYMFHPVYLSIPQSFNPPRTLIQRFLISFLFFFFFFLPDDVLFWLKRKGKIKRNQQMDFPLNRQYMQSLPLKEDLNLN